MTATFITAKDQMFALFNSAWKAKTAAIVGYIPEIRWQGKEEAGTPDASKYWCRVSRIAVNEEQTNVARDVGGIGKARYTADGMIFVQLFCPKSDPQVQLKGEQLAIVARDSYRGKTTSGNIVFRNVRINPLDPEVNAIRFNVIADYEYDEIG